MKPCERRRMERERGVRCLKRCAIELSQANSPEGSISGLFAGFAPRDETAGYGYGECNVPAAQPSVVPWETDLPPLTEEESPLAVLSSPPLTEESGWLALFSAPPLTEEKPPLAMLPSPPLTQFKILLAVLTL